jgi:hypothetical protein
MRRNVSSILAAALLGLTLGACQREDPRLKDLTIGISKDSTLNLMGIGTPERPESYLINGQMIETVILRREGADGPLDSLSTDQYTPLVMIDNKLAGWGWKYWDSVRAAHNIQGGDTTSR